MIRLDRQGRLIRPLDLVAGPGADDHTIDLPLAGFAPGDYAIEVKAVSGGRLASERSPFRVTF